MLKNVTDDGSGKLTIGSYQNFTGAALDLTGQITDSDGNTYAITALGGSAFHGCGTLTTVALPESLTSIETYAFYSCSDLATVDFSRCTNLTIIDMYAFSNCTSLAAVDLSGCTNLSSIGQCTFTSCDDLTSMTLPNSLTGIGDEAFYGCSNLDELVLLSKNPPTLGEDALLAVSQDFRIIVPEENAEAYKTAEGWKDVAGSVHGLTYQLEVTPPNGSLEIFRGGEPPRGQIPRR
ncbi:leucine-rich repeat protein [Pseudoflavonifractor phocaeensis]|uniref:leucine-rich repeat protein n=1 Tax=Pseudoflavonifractor phocaeensis TaxID=1870988 RepID=UPI00195BF910|nr:leucine-rich repeat domain-containing protein [Pseudoflavonifractor phocaeensis]